MAREPRRKRNAEASNETSPPNAPELTWLKAAYAFHTFTYRDPRSPQSSAPGLPLASPTAVVLGIASTLFNLGQADEARRFLAQAHLCQVVIDPPPGAVFFRAFHQLRRYETDKYGSNPRLGLTQINQGTREHALIEDCLRIYIGVPPALADSVTVALRNRDHLGTHDSLCSLIGDIESCPEPTNVVFLSPEQWQNQPPSVRGVSIVTLARFRGPLRPAVGDRWWMAGGPETELVPFLIQGTFIGTSRGRIFKKTDSAGRP
jgi:hypothetical protein